jgi:hypothetical protein
MAVDINTAALNPLIPKPTNFMGIGSLQGGLNQQSMGEAGASLQTELDESAVSERSLQVAKDDLAAQRAILQQKIDEKNKLQGEKTQLQGQVTTLESNLAVANQQLADAQRAFDASEQRRKDAEAEAARLRATPAYSAPAQAQAYTPPPPAASPQYGVQAQSIYAANPVNAFRPPEPPPVIAPPPAPAPIVPMRFGVSDAFRPPTPAPAPVPIVLPPQPPQQNTNKGDLSTMGVRF